MDCLIVKSVHRIKSTKTGCFHVPIYLYTLLQRIPIFVLIFFIDKSNSLFIVGYSGKFPNSYPETKLT